MPDVNIPTSHAVASLCDALYAIVRVLEEQTSVLRLIQRTTETIAERLDAIADNLPRD